METKKATQFTKNQQDQLLAIEESATELIEAARELPFNDAFEATLIQLQQKYPLVLPMLLLEAICSVIQNSPNYDTSAKADALSSRKAWKEWREDLYRDLDLTFNV